jgi:hypothetical protein
MHGAIDYGLLALNLAGPTLLDQKGSARGLSYLFGAVQGGLNAFTDQPLALSRLVPFRTHGTMELSSMPLFLALPWLTGATKNPTARNYFLALGALLFTVYNLTDWDAAPEE